MAVAAAAAATPGGGVLRCGMAMGRGAAGWLRRRRCVAFRLARLSPLHTGLLDFLASPCGFQDAFSNCLSVLRIETGSPPRGSNGVTGGIKEVREKLSFYFLSLALGKYTDCSLLLLYVLRPWSRSFYYAFFKL